MAVKNFYFLSSATTDLSGPMQEDGVAPTTAALSPAQGWIAGASLGTGLYSEVRTGTERAASTFTATVEPGATKVGTAPGDAWRIPNPLTGDFPAGNWTISMLVRAVTAAYTGRCRLRFRVYKGTTWATSTELTTTTLLTNATTANLSIASGATLSTTWAAPAINMNNEYLYFNFALETTAAGTTGAGQDIDLFAGSASVVTTTNFASVITESAITRGDGIASVTLNPTVVRRGAFASAGVAASSLVGREILQGNMQANGSGNALPNSRVLRQTGFGGTGQSQVSLSSIRSQSALMQSAGSGGSLMSPLRRLGALLSASGGSGSELIPRVLRRGIMTSQGGTTWDAYGATILGAGFASTGLSSPSLAPVRVSSGSITVGGISGVIFAPRRRLSGGFSATGIAFVDLLPRAKYSSGFNSGGRADVFWTPEGGPRLIVAQTAMGGTSSSTLVSRVLRLGGMNVQGMTSVAALPVRQQNVAIWTDGQAGVSLEPRKLAIGRLVADGRGGFLLVVEADEEPELWIPTGEFNSVVIVTTADNFADVVPTWNEVEIVHE